MKSVAAIITLLVGSSSAFAPLSTNSRSSSSALSATAFGDRPGVIVPTGYFDPLNLATSEAKFDQFRAAELKHGRVAMLAVVGYVVPEFYRWGGEINFGLKFADIPNGIAAVTAVPFLGWVQIITLIGFVEIVRIFFLVRNRPLYVIRQRLSPTFYEYAARPFPRKIRMTPNVVSVV
jgi:Chlorophyll A-B binding protein